MRPVKINESLLHDLYVHLELTAKECAKILGVSDTSICRRLKKLGIRVRPPIRGLMTNISDDQVIDLYWNNKLSICETAKKLGVSEGCVKKRLNKSGKGTRTVREGARLWRGSDEILDDQLIHLYDVCGWSCEKISAHFNKSSQFTRHRFIAMGKERRKNTGKNNGSWKGGINDIGSAVRGCATSLQWRKDAFSKQQYKSEISNQQIRELNCHHIYPFHVILRSSITKHTPLPDEYRSLAIVNDPRFYDGQNGLVVSKEEHDNIEMGKLDQAHPWWKIWQAYPSFAINRSDFNDMDFDLFNDKGMIRPTDYSINISPVGDIKHIIRYEHYLGTIPGSKLILVARQKSVIVGIATFGKGTNRNIPDNTWELTRLCIPFYVVRPFACEFLDRCYGYIRENYPQIKELVSFADSSVGHNGGIYRMAKWAKNGQTPPSYAYFDPATFKLMHKSACRRIKGVDKTERELADERGWIRIPLTHKYKYSLIL
ncbi:hypothetical protein LCGC14_0141080 [marine sediment metagenome]|uniref:Uncharacterized protein n=1 Tax=marine sediment metagenome TaxID=412755 RepID=A0A0F9VGB5_9ZZZZ